MNRIRYFLRLMICFLAVFICLSASAIGEQSQNERTLSFYNTHTHERLTVTYKKENAYIPEALEKISHILRDHRTGDIQRLEAGPGRRTP